MFKNNQKKTLKAIIIFLIIIAYVVFLQTLKIYSPITYITNIKTPTTGMTRAWLSLLNLEIKLAFQYNAMFLMAPFLALTTLLYLMKNDKRYLKVAIFLAIILFIYNLGRIF